MENWHAHLVNVPIEWIYAILAAFGGAARYLNMYLKDGKFLLANFIANILIAAFSGLMFAFVAESMHFQGSWMFAFAGIGGFAGHNALEFLVGFLKRKITS